MVRPGTPVGVHVLVERGGQMLMLRRCGTGFFDGLYSLPGGHVEPGESLCQAAMRELMEETGLHAEVEALDYLGVVHRLSDTNRIDFFFMARCWHGEPRLREPERCDDLAWFDACKLPHNTVPYIREALGAGPGPWMLESGWTAQTVSFTSSRMSAP
jgi:ADP-ribose pyrophosphatase YjhB (NUDIX family)